MDSRFLSSSEDSGSSSQHNYGTTTVTFNIIATAIFVVVSYCFFLPCNRFIPLDRRSVAMLGATLCYATRSFFFPSNKLDLVEAVDFDVLVLLFGIMAINFIMVHQRETKSLIIYVQTQIQENPKRGFWLVSLAAFVVSPLLTNDGVCLLFVEPILNAFKGLSSPDDSTHSMSSVTETLSSSFPLEKGDAFYFLLALACSANIGSALTYTGNPQVHI
jgi:Na+/H+ antiporter NhaD/arsenite permease-like protein